MLRAQLAAIAENRLFKYQQPFIDDLGPNFMIKMLGATGYTTIDPKNLEAILSTRFEGPPSQPLFGGVQATLLTKICRLRFGRSTRSSAAFHRRRNFHARWDSLETFPRIVASAISQKPLPRPERLWRAHR